MNFFAAPAIIAAAYHAFALFAALRHQTATRSRTPAPRLNKIPKRGVTVREPSPDPPPVSILKPVRGTGHRFAAAIASHAAQDYPQYEILFGISDSADPARAEIERLIESHPALPIRLIVVSTDAPNTKVGVLERLAAEARYPVFLVNDSDILVAPDYLQAAVAPLQDEHTGLVTCLYRGRGGSFPTRSEALGIATEFAPSVFVARLVGVKEFAMGSTLAFRARDLARIGGFASIRDYLADDYQLGKRLARLRLDVVLARPVVETCLGAGTWRDVWKHQVRWSRTVRVSRPGGYIGYAITHAAFWCLVALLTGNIRAALVCYLVRALSGLFIAAQAMRDNRSLALGWWLPVRDLFGFAVWIAGLFGNSVEWRGQRLLIDRSGRIL